MSAMFPSVAEAFPRVTRPLEGCVLWPYLDVFGIPTEGYGCAEQNLAAFVAVDWTRADGQPITDNYKVAQYSAIKAQPKALNFNRYKNATALRLTQDAADALLDSRANEFASYMAAHYFADWDTWPADAQLAWMLIAWACGPGCPTEFKTACALAEHRQWDAMRKWAKINPGKPGTAGWNPGVVPRNAQIDLCLANAAAIDNADGYATPALYWPGHVLDSPKTIADTMPAAALAASALASYDVNAADCGLTGSCHLPLAA
jgi:hypothetical protein